MVKATEKLFEQVDELMMLTSKCFDIREFKSMDPDMLRALQLTLEMMDTAKELSMKQAEAMSKIDAIDKKLDKLLSKRD